GGRFFGRKPLARFARAPSRPSAVLPLAPAARPLPPARRRRCLPPLRSSLVGGRAAPPRGRRSWVVFGVLPQLAGGVARRAEGARISPPACWGSTGEAGEGVGSSDASLWRTGEMSEWPLWKRPKGGAPRVSSVHSGGAFHQP